MIRVLLTLLLAISLRASEFYNGQAARAVLGQSSFSSREPGVSASAMALVNSHLYVADSADRVLTFDLSKIPGGAEEVSVRSGLACTLCGFSPVASVTQPVAPGSATVSVKGKTVAAIDTRNHRVLLWRDVTSASAAHGPDVVLQASDPQSAVLSESTLIDPISIALDGVRLFVGDAALRRVLVWKSLPTVNNQPADVVLGQRDFVAHEKADSPRADTISRPSVLASDGTNLFVGDSLDRRILVFSPSDLHLASDAAVNAATLSPGPLAPGTLVTITGNGLSDQSAAAPDDGSDPLPNKLAGVEALFDGIPLPLVAVSPSEVKAQLPYVSASLTSASLYLRIEHNGGGAIVTNPIALSLVPASPGLFAFGGTEPRPGMLLHASGPPVTSDDPAAAGEVITVWASGLHVIGSGSDQALTAGVPYAGSNAIFAQLRASVNGQAAEVEDLSLPRSSIGVYQIRIALPPTVSGNSAAQLVVTQDGLASNAITFPVKRSSNF
ncbi:MAG: hypothetical protein M3Y57_10690 [Acidobacteriota bacterium]|nr:hypothetical protein [Acidobacteriota bacterium]